LASRFKVQEVIHIFERLFWVVFELAVTLEETVVLAESDTEVGMVEAIWI